MFSKKPSATEINRTLRSIQLKYENLKEKKRARHAERQLQLQIQNLEALINRKIELIEGVYTITSELLYSEDLLVEVKIKVDMANLYRKHITEVTSRLGIIDKHSEEEIVRLYSVCIQKIKTWLMDNNFTVYTDVKGYISVKENIC
jgi:hypothetical protein